MTRFEMIKYHGKKYPSEIPLYTEEIATHFDVEKIGSVLGYSLHTEYSYGKRKFEGRIVNQFSELIAAQKDGVPQLWKNETWALQFADYIVTLINEKRPPTVIEIHPPFSDYTNMEAFIKNYSVFEKEIKRRFPDVSILIENRCGSIYRGGKFIISKTQDLFKLVELIEREKLQLRIAYDVPQIYTAHSVKRNEQYISLLEDAMKIRQYIGGVHLWGKKVSKTGRKVSHCGDLNSYFDNPVLKEKFLQMFKKCFDDNIIRTMVLEVNSGNDDLTSIIMDLKGVGIEFV